MAGDSLSDSYIVSINLGKAQVRTKSSLLKHLRNDPCYVHGNYFAINSIFISTPGTNVISH